MEDLHTNKRTKEIRDPVAREVIEATRKKKEDYLLSQAADGSTEASAIPLQIINQFVLEETPMDRGLKFGLGSVTLLTERSEPSCSNVHQQPDFQHQVNEAVDLLRTQLQADMKSQLDEITMFQDTMKAELVETMKAELAEAVKTTVKATLKSMKKMEQKRSGKGKGKSKEMSDE